MWHDHTMKKLKEVHPFMNPKREVHLVATLFENFAILPPTWIKHLHDRSSLGLDVGHVTDVNWGYEVWAGNKEGSNCVDVAIHLKDEHRDAVIVVEAKKPGGTLGRKDLDPGTYLDQPSFGFTKRRALLYLVGEEDVEFVKENVLETGNHHWGVLGWQELAGLQIGLVQELAADPPLRHFIASAIQYQFAQHGLPPDSLSSLYLSTEPKLEPKLTDWESQEWKLPGTL